MRKPKAGKKMKAATKRNSGVRNEPAGVPVARLTAPSQYEDIGREDGALKELGHARLSVAPGSVRQGVNGGFVDRVTVVTYEGRSRGKRSVAIPAGGPSTSSGAGSTGAHRLETIWRRRSVPRRSLPPEGTGKFRATSAGCGERARCRQHGPVRAARADDLQPNRQTRSGRSAWRRDGGLLTEIDRIAERRDLVCQNVRMLD